jgi:undecaprenyl-diphosphatase
MEAVARVDSAVLLWLNGWVGAFPWLDAAVGLLVGDYLVPVLLSLFLLGMWYGARSPESRVRHQKAVFISLAGMGFSNLAVFVLNHLVFRPRPFVEHQLNLLFYRPTDPSFPANPAAMGFAMATGIWLANRKMGIVAYVIAALWSLARVYAGVFYPSDVIAGGLIGVVIVLLVALVFRLLDPIPSLVLWVARRLYLA